MSNVQSLHSHTVDTNSVYFLDCVVLLYLFYPNGGYDLDIAAEYSHLYSQLISKKSKILCTRTLVSEFVNRYLRIEYQYYLKEHNLTADKFDFKCGFKKTSNYTDALKSVTYIISTNFSFFTFAETSSEFDIDQLLNQYTNINYFDYNDAEYIMLTQEHNAILVTHDSDFNHLTEQISILTANTNMF